MVQLDLADLASVAKVSAQLQAEPRLDLLILNAGVMACPQSYTKDGFEMQIGTNHFGAGPGLASSGFRARSRVQGSLQVLRVNVITG